jgi:hypothetical protein
MGWIQEEAAPREFLERNLDAEVTNRIMEGKEGGAGSTGQTIVGLKPIQWGFSKQKK